MRRGTLGAASTNELALRWQRHRDHDAREELFHRFLPLAGQLARRYMASHEPLEDLVQVGAVGLIGAVDRFDPDRGVEFSAFAVPTILGELKRHLRDTGWAVHVPRGAQELALRVDSASRQITAQTGRTPEPQELAEVLELNLEDVRVGLDARTAHYSVSLNAPAAGTEDGNPETLGDRVGAEDGELDMVETTLAFSAAIRRLPYLERQALNLRIGDNMKQTEIACQLGCSQMQVSRLLRRAAFTLRRLTNAATYAENPHDPSSTELRARGRPGTAGELPPSATRTPRRR